MIGNAGHWDDRFVTRHSKPASRGRLKSGDVESDVAGLKGSFR